MSDRYPHLSDTDYPNLGNENVWQYQNNFDFEKFNDIQMHIKVCSVPWDLGEVHVGLRSIPMGNVVGWESKEQRDAWLDALPGIEWDTNYRSYHDGGTIKLPVPYEYLSYYNYIIVDYSKPPVEYATGEGITRFLYFIRDLKQLSINNTQCEIKRDTWSMFINDISFSHMMLERGHYALAKSASVSTYLSNPIDNTDYLLTPDASYGEPSNETEIGVINFETTSMMYVLASTANVYSTDWGTKDTDGWRTPPVTKKHTEQDSPSYFIFGFEATSDRIHEFWTAVNEQCPQFTQTVKAAYFISTDLCIAQDYFQFCGIDVYTLKASNQQVEFGSLTKDSFNYPENYKSLTKLYTSPYCCIEVTDGNGNDVRINVEDMGSNAIRAYRYLSIAYPYMSITAYLANVGSGKGEKEIKYQKVGQRNFKYSGRFWDAYWRMEIPTYAIMEDAELHNDYANWYSYTASKEQLEKQLAGEKKTLDTKLDANKGMAYDSEGLARYTTKKNNAMNTDLVKGTDSVSMSCPYYVIDPTISTDEPQLYSVTYSFTGGGANASVEANSELSSYLSAKQIEYSNQVIKATQLAEAESRDKTVSVANVGSLTTTANSATASTTAASNSMWAGIGSGAIGGITGVGNAETVGAGIGAVGGFIGSTLTGMLNNLSATTSASISNINAQINASTASASAAIVTNLDKTVSQLTRDTNQLNLEQTSKYTAKSAAVQKARNNYVLSKQNANATSVTNANAESTDHNYQINKAMTLGGDYTRFVKDGDISSDGSCSTTTDTIAKDDSLYYVDKDTRESILKNQIKRSKDNASIQAPIERGAFTGGETQSVKPLALWASVITQPNDAIAQAGNEFLRYGYRWEGSVDFEGFNMMPKFTYWKVSDIWANAQNLPDAWVDEIRMFLMQGVTVWRKPEYINNTSIFDN